MRSTYLSSQKQTGVQGARSGFLNFHSGWLAGWPWVCFLISFCFNYLNCFPPTFCKLICLRHFERCWANNGYCIMPVTIISNSSYQEKRISWKRSTLFFNVKKKPRTPTSHFSNNLDCESIITVCLQMSFMHFVFSLEITHQIQRFYLISMHVYIGM